ncbi:unnamed protein product [Nesidiocoris tenuis]|uniref:Uncharacterized protein n=1 Tax=Nesidiocoris tenuis TaxID=355587 RepID=A0A6H5GNQ5_9HEMI|nr:unnamed protein product [Nesidiocoris tenuis]
MDFSKRDFQLFTCGIDKVNKYCLKTGRLLYVHETNTSNALSITTSPDGSAFIIATGDGKISVYQQKSTRGGKDDKTEEYDLKKRIDLNQSALNCVTLACDDTVLLAAGQSSIIVSVGYPLPSDSVDMKIFKIHSSPIIKMDVSQVTGTVLSLGRDGVVTVWNVSNQKRKTKHFREVDEIIIRPARWSNKRTIIEEQQETMANIDKEYHTKLKEIAADKETEEAQIHGKYQGVLDIIGLNNRITLAKNISSLDKMVYQKEETARNFELELRQQRENFENRLKLEREDLDKWRTSWSNVKNGFEKLIDSVKMAGQCVSKRLEYFSAMELTRRVNETFALRDDILQIIEEQKSRELTLLKHSQIEVDELVENSERHEQTAVEFIQLKFQKQKLCEQVEGLENTYYNMQEFLKEIQKTVATLDRRASQRATVQAKQRKILDKLEAIRESGRNIVDDLNVSEEFHIRHMVTEECIERLCQVNCLLRERTELKTKVQWLEQELAHSTKSLVRLRYVLSFMALQSYLHHHSLQRTISVEKDRGRKLRFFKTNFKKEIHNLLCCTDHSALKGRLINLCSQYGDPKVDFLQLLDRLSGGQGTLEGHGTFRSHETPFGEVRQ